MSLLRTPPRMVTRAHAKSIQTKDGNLNNTVLLNDQTAQRAGTGESHSIKSTRTSSSAAARKLLEYEAAQAKALIELREAEAELTLNKARIEKELIDKELAAKLADVEQNSQRSPSSSSCKSKVESWLADSVAALDIDINKGGHDFNHHSSPCHKPQNPSQPPTAANTNTAIEALTVAITNAVGAAASKASNVEVLSRLATSKDLPLYFGDPLEWLHFKEAFQESTHLCNYSDSENLWRLRKCLRGDAKEAASSLLMTTTSPQEIMDVLELRFGRPENIMRIVSYQLRKLQPLPDAYHTEIVNFAIKIKNFVTTTKAVKENDYLRSPELVRIVLSKLPTALINKWAEHLYNQDRNDVPKLELISSFLYEEAKKAALSGVSYIHTQTAFRPKTQTVDNRNRQAVLVCSDANIEPETSRKCKFCRKAIHTLDACTTFKRAMRRDRWRYVRVNKLCYKCLGTRHREISDCTANDCDFEGCGGSHHRLLHWVKPETAHQDTSASRNGPPQQDGNQPSASRANESQRSEESILVADVPVSSNTSKILLKIVPVTINGPKSSVKTFALLDDGATVSLISADVADKAGLHGENFTMRATSAWDSSELNDIPKIRQAVNWAVELGYRHIDTASLYGNEAEIGKGIADVIGKGLVTREELFITTKLWNDKHAEEDVVPALRESLNKLGLDYVDLYLIHSPESTRPDGTSANIDILETWQGMVEARRLGLAKSIGVSNFNIEQLDKIIGKSPIVPAVNQVEIHPSNTQESIVADCHQRGIHVTAYSPFGFFVSRAGSGRPGVNDPKMLNIANKYGKSITQVLLRYLIDRDLIPIPKTTNKARLEENINVFDFQLTSDEINTINSFNTNSSIFD